MTKAIFLPVKGAVYISPEAAAICPIVMLLCFCRGQEDLWQKQPWSRVTKLINTQLQLSLLSCKLTGGYDISAEPKTNKRRDIYSFHIAVAAVSKHIGSVVNTVRIIKSTADSS